MSFAHLHVHTEYSVLDGASKIKKLIQAAEKDNQPALAITDHGNMFGVKEFLDTFKKLDSKVKPIVGCEVYVAKGSRTERKGREDQSSYHLILLAKNLQGYKNLTKMVSYGYIDGFHYKPRIDRELLEKYHEGVICSSACIGGEVPQGILKDNIAAAEEAVIWYKNLFGEDYYLEVQRHETNIVGANDTAYPLQQEANNVLFELGQKHNIKVIATNDVHFVSKEDGPAHDRLICVSTNADYEDPNRLRYTQQEYLKTSDQMKEIFKDHPEVISNTLEIVEKIEVYSLDSEPLMPPFPIPSDFTDSNDYLRHLAYEGAKKRYSEIGTELTERIDFELETIKKMGFPDYFLIVQDFIIAARKMDVSVGPGRGSAAGSVVAYCLTITDIDPIKYQLLFERFLNPDRVSMPDIDIDFDDDGRYKVLKYVEDKYGKEQVAHVVTFGTMGTKSAIKDIARIQKVPLQDSERLSKLVPKSIEISIIKEEADKDNPGKTIKRKEKKDVAPTVALCMEKMQEFKEAFSNGSPELKDTLTYAQVLEGTVRNTGVHACAIIIGPEELTNLIPISTTKDKETGEDIYVSQFEGKLIESVGLLKMDFLGLRTLSIIKESIANIKKSKGIDLDIDQIPIDDKKTFELFSKGETIGIFQFESDGMQKWLKELKPTRFEDLIAMNALYRPGPMEYIPDFIARKHGRNEIKYDLPEMEEYLEDTYGVTVYQEQVMLLSQKIANFSKGKADVLRKAMGKKQLSVMATLKEEFFAGGLSNNHPEAILNKIWNDWKAFAEYAFNKSHSTCYAWIGYQTAYLKAHHLAEFLAANLSKNLNNIEEIAKLMDDSRKMGIQVLGPNINESFTNFTVNKEGNIRFGMGGIKGIGSSAVNSIIAVRDESGAFKDTFDFIERVNSSSINKKGVDSLIYAGAFDMFTEVNRGTFAIENEKGETFLETYLRYGALFQRDSQSTESSLFGEMVIETSRPTIPPLPTLNQNEILKKEKELVGMYLSAHPLDCFKFELKEFTDVQISNLEQMKDQALDDLSLMGKEFYIGGMITSVVTKLSKKSNKPWSSINVEDFTGNTSFILFGQDYESYLGYLKEGTPLLIKIVFSPRYSYLSAEEKEKSGGFQKERPSPIGCDIRIRKMTLLAHASDNFLKEIKIDIPLEKINKNFRKELIKVAKGNKGSAVFTLNIIDSQEKISAEFFSRKYKLSPTQEFFDFLDTNTIKYYIAKDVK